MIDLIEYKGSSTNLTNGIQVPLCRIDNTFDHLYFIYKQSTCKW